MNLTDDQLRKQLPTSIRLEYPLTDRHGERPQVFWLTDDLQVRLSTGDYVTIPAGFETDFASVPKFLWSIMPAIGDHNLADVLHDYLYSKNLLPRADCDAEFLTYMRVLRPHPKSWLDNHLRWLAVRWFGGPAYRSCGKLHA